MVLVHSGTGGGVVGQSYSAVVDPPSQKGHCHWWMFVDIHDVNTQHFREMLYKPIILAMEIHEL